MAAAAPRISSATATSAKSHHPLLLSARSPVAAGNRRRGCSVRPLPASKTLITPGESDLEEGLSNVQTLLHRRLKSGRETLAIVDSLKRLCVDHYFQDEIERAMTAYCSHLLHSDDLHDATLAFRLMREAGHDVCADDVLRRFTDGAGEFRHLAVRDVRGLLSLHDTAQLSVPGEASLEKARLFSRKHLASAVRQYLEPGLARYVRQSLEHPHHRSPAQFKARHHLSYLQSLPVRNTAMEELAAAEFELKKLLHQSEMHEVRRWWLDLGLAKEIPVARDQVVKWYMWPITILQESSHSKYRVQIAKIVSFIYVVDDIFDLVGTLEELSLFTEAIKMWDPAAAADSLPSCMRSCYRALYTVTNEIADMAENEHGWNPIDHLKKAWAELFDGFMVEARWLATGRVPAAADYLRNGVVTSGVPLLFAHILFLLGQHDDDDHVAASASKLMEQQNPSGAVSCAGKILRLWDDMGSAKDEAQEGVDGSYRDLYLAENPGRAMADAEDHVRGLIGKAWEELNGECFGRRRCGGGFTLACLNLARMVGVAYAYDGHHRLPALEDYARMLLL